jgi:beta-glucanase (GH16 family)
MNTSLLLSRLLRAAVLAMTMAAGRSLAEPTTTAPAPSVWKLIWSDDFNGTSLDGSKWGFDLGNGFKAPNGDVWVSGWGNNELEYYTDRSQNAYVKDGLLHIRADAEAMNGCKYTSARLVTRGLFSKTYGRFEFRAKLPTGRGLWPAIWLLPADNAYGTWAASGEIDILEARGQHPFKVLGTLHYGETWPKNDFTEADYDLPAGGTVADFHVYALEWEPGAMRWYVDDHLYSVKRHWWSGSSGNGNGNGNEKDRNPWPAPFDKSFYIIMNLAVGGNFLGDPDAQTLLPQEMQVDYVRVYDRVGGYGPTPPPGIDEGIERGGAADASTTLDKSRNLARGKPATASSEENTQHTAAMANDGDPATRWCAKSGDVPQWWQVDLTAPANLRGAQLRWEMDGRIYRYIVEGSADGNAWRPLSDQSNSTSTWRMQNIAFRAAGIRYVRVRIVNLEPNTWASLAEVRVFGGE